MIKKVWEKHVQPRVKSNPAHEEYFFCFDDDDDDVDCVFQVFTDDESVRTFMAGQWYRQYLDEVAKYVQEAPVLNRASPIWIKGRMSQ